MAIEEKDRLGSLLKYEADKNYCREVVTIASGQNLKMGSVVVEDLDDGTYSLVSLDSGLSAQSDNADDASANDATAADSSSASDSVSVNSQVMGVLLEDIDASSAAKEAVIVARDAIVIKSALVFPDDATADQKKQIIKSLEARGIVARVTA